MKAHDVKIYLHTLPLGGFIRAVDEKDYLNALKHAAIHNQARHEAQYELETLKLELENTRAALASTRAKKDSFSIG